jgi:hypothetical protein
MLEIKRVQSYSNKTVWLEVRIQPTFNSFATRQLIIITQTKKL